MIGGAALGTASTGTVACCITLSVVEPRSSRPAR
jgi:hypothetical protein